MKIALDYDETFTRDPHLWTAFAQEAKKRGHDIRIVTFRTDEWHNDDLKNILVSVGCEWLPIIYTRANRKRDWCARMHNWFPDVWIDDMPELIVADNTYIPREMLARQQGYMSDKSE